MNTIRLQTIKAICLSLILLLTGTKTARAESYEREPINYSESMPANDISLLQERINAGELTLAYDDQFGYLKSLLNTLDVPVSSQLLVFTKTSLQRSFISPAHPRAVYFNDDVYLGYCQNGEVMEVSVADPALGTVFYTLDQTEVERPQFRRRTHECLSCHANPRTELVPGHVVRSLYSDTRGYPILSGGGRGVNHSTAFEDRWGGWYVSGKHGSEHLGNFTIEGRDVPHPLESAAAQNVTDLSTLFDTTPYLSPHSDLVALMVHEHQTTGHNLITKLNFATRQAHYYEESLNKQLGEEPGHRWESAVSRINNAVNDLVEYLLFCDEASLPGPVVGTSEFAKEFAARGPFDKQGRSLREFDLETRLFKYPCSFLVYSRSIAALPDEARELLWQRMREVLSGENDSETFAHLDAETRLAINEILTETLPGFAAKPV
ncbi:hypothetical protein [Calycomorphotria hydatis]|uniref:Cytochrome c domain-containing protein n=1 Tax=Calycomorphotria hydatis TaxID=2528027 RepID=A0A517TC60_9PLAN|nr:hypothetical protein [Calycomorphotria hydatis]QDT65961.1 hypothetical protein V22_32250 [Calycomorphotria hydatis]